MHRIMEGQTLAPILKPSTCFRRYSEMSQKHEWIYLCFWFQGMIWQPQLITDWCEFHLLNIYFFSFVTFSQWLHKQQPFCTVILPALLMLFFFCTLKSQPVSGSEELLNMHVQMHIQANLSFLASFFFFFLFLKYFHNFTWNFRINVVCGTSEMK